jgi:hypothetical protein
MGFQSTGFQNLGNWLARLARLDLTVFDDVKDDAAATAPALAVVVAASLLAGLGSWLWWIFEIDFPGDIGEKNLEAFWKTFILGGIFMAALWLLWVYISAMILSRAFRASADLNQLIRTTGLAFAPMAISVLIVISVLGVPFGVIAVAATVLLVNAAIQATTDGQPHQVVIANLAGFAVFAIALGILNNIAQISFDFGAGLGAEYGGLAPGIFFFDLNV